MKRRMRLSALLFLVLILAALAAAAAGIWKVNRKINTLSETVQNMREIRDTAAVFDRNAYIPDLDPHTDGWKVTQFGDVTASQEMCYAITTETGLILIDGGYSYETPRLRRIIAQYGNTVEAWILTHPHPDHITAFLDIYGDPQGIVIHHIYAPSFPDREEMEKRASWDDFTALDRMLEMNVAGVEHVQAGDAFDLLGLHFQILSAYDEEVDAVSRDLMNDGSLVFRISGAQDSMLFCADIGKNMTDLLTRRWGSALKSDYVQMGHHGFGGPGKEFYREVSPRTAFFDAPDWLVHGEGDRSTAEKEKLMREMGCEIVMWYTAPNQILIR